MDFKLDLDYQEIALQYIPNKKLAEEIQNNIRFVEKYYGDVDSRYKEVEDQQIVYKQLGIIVFSCVEALWKGIVMAVNENCTKRKCSCKQCKYKKFETREKINRASVDKVLDHLVNMRLLYVHPFEREEIEELQQLRNHIHLTRTVTDEVDRKIFDKDFVENMLRLYYVTLNQLDLCNWYFSETAPCLKEMDEDGYESTDQYQVWDRREYFTQKVFNACHALFYHEPLNTKETFNEFYFKKCVCAAIIYRTTDNYLESNKDSAKRQTGFWYKAGGYKLDIVPYSIAKIISSIPAGYVLDWNHIWQKQAVSPAFMREIEIVTKMTNDFICDSHGVIVTEYCKKEETWNKFRDTVKYIPSEKFINELVSSGFMKEQESAVQKEQKELDDLRYVMQIIEAGADYWDRLMQEGLAKNALSYADRTYLTQAKDFAEKAIIPQANSSGKVPMKVMQMAKAVLDVRDKLESLGIKV